MTRELLETRAAAGERYAAATRELHGPVRTFFDVPQNLGTLAHPVFAPADTVTCWRDEIKSRRDELLAKFEVAK
jgi:hypothetical protein